MQRNQQVSRRELEDWQPRHAFLVGLDSDGCVLNTMEPKQRLCFHPRIVCRWRLEPAAPLVRQTAEFVNLFSRYRGRNRFLNLLKTFELLGARSDWPPAVELPDMTPLKRFVDSGAPLGNAALREAASRSGEATLSTVLAWSEQVDDDVRRLGRLPVFPAAVPCLRTLRAECDVLCTSQTPAERVMQEWADNDLLGFADLAAGPELGSKSEHLRLVTAGRYAPGRVLMVGDSPGDLETARDAGALFFPILPGREQASWEHLKEEGLPRFLAGRFAGSYAAGLTTAFEALLPDRPPWTA